MKRIRCVLSAMCWLTMALNSPFSQAAQDVAGVRFEDQCKLANQSLTLNGAGVRVKMIVKVYAVGLYVPHKETAPAAILNQPGPKSIRIVMLRDVSAERLAEGLLQGMLDNLTDAERRALQPRLDELESAMLSAGDASKGSLIQLDYLPGVGTHVTVGGKAMGRDIAGEDFYRALLKIWLGDKPSDRGLKGDLLGLS